MSIKEKECDLIYLSEILNSSFSSHKITTISNRLNILSISVIHIFLLFLIPKGFSVTSLPNTPWDTFLFSLSPHLQGFQTAFFTMLLIFLTFMQVFQLIYLFSVEAFQILSPLAMSISSGISTSLYPSQHWDRLPRYLHLDKTSWWLENWDGSCLFQECVVAHHKSRQLPSHAHSSWQQHPLPATHCSGFQPVCSHTEVAPICCSSGFPPRPAHLLSLNRQGFLKSC